MDDGIKQSKNPSEPSIKKAIASQADRLAMSTAATATLTALIEQLRVNIPEAHISKTDLANYIIQHHPKEYSSRQVRQIEEFFFDDVKFAKRALHELEKRRAQGDSITLHMLMKELRPKYARPTGLHKKSEKQPRRSLSLENEMADG